MHWKQVERRYDFLSIALHWFIAIFTVALFISGLWMVDLGYYDDWYYQAPWWHKGIGIITAFLVIMRWVWTLFRQSPAAIRSTPLWQHLVAKLVHKLMNLSILALFISGYVMVTAKGDSLNLFDWLLIPALFSDKSHWVDPAGVIHLWSGYFIIALATLHALAAIKHHFIDKDATLKRMLGINTGELE